MFLHGDWDLGSSGLSASDPEIQGLLAELRSLTGSARATGTFRSYSGPWLHFKQWCQTKGVPSLPASPLSVALYLTLLLRSAKSPSPILTCSASIYLHHSLAGFPSPTQHSLVAMVREIAKRTRLSGQNVKSPLLASHVRRLFDTWRWGSEHSLHSVMRLTAVCLCFAGFLRCSDLLTIQWQEIRFLPSHMELFIEKSKTDQYRAGRWVLIARVAGPYCPVGLTEHLITLGKYSQFGPGGLIRNCTVTSSQQHIRREQPCYTTVLGWFKDGARSLGLDPAKFGTHSGRRGGATRAANVDVPDRLFKQHGGWRSERAKDSYVVAKLQARLSVTENLGLQSAVSLDEVCRFERESGLA